MNLSEIPSNGGWMFEQPQTGWGIRRPLSTGLTHDQAVSEIIRHRRANPAITIKHSLATDPASVSAELVRYQQARGAMPIDQLPPLTPPSQPAPQVPGASSASVVVIKKIASGAASLMEWEQAGMVPVDQATAEARAAICSVCPKNQQGKSLSEIFTTPLANIIKTKVERLNTMNLRTQSDDKLFTCQACNCAMRLKVWLPKELIDKRRKPEWDAELNQANPRCWILS